MARYTGETALCPLSASVELFSLQTLHLLVRPERGTMRIIYQYTPLLSSAFEKQYRENACPKYTSVVHSSFPVLWVYYNIDSFFLQYTDTEISKNFLKYERVFSEDPIGPDFIQGLRYNPCFLNIVCSKICPLKRASFRVAIAL